MLPPHACEYPFVRGLVLRLVLFSGALILLTFGKAHKQPIAMVLAWIYGFCATEEFYASYTAFRACVGGA